MKHTAMSELQCLVIGSIISADNDTLSEEEKQSIISKMGSAYEDHNWYEVLSGIKDETKRKKYIELLEYA
jgi:hypothetical protein